MRTRHPSTVLAALLVTDIVLLLIAAALTPHQNPALPIELSVVLAGLTAWQLARRSRAAAMATAVFTGLLVALTAHILSGDLGKGLRELVPDVLILLTTTATLVLAAVAARGTRSKQTATTSLG